MTIAAGTVSMKHNLSRAFIDGLIDNYDEKVASSKKRTLFYTHTRR